GCHVMSHNKTHVTCSCEHLTSFAVLMSYSAHEQGINYKTKELDFITYFGCCLSLVSMLLAFVTFTCFKNLRCDRNSIHKNLVANLFVAELIFCLGINQQCMPTLCSVISILLHYFFLTSFCWMCMEGVHLYILVVVVFNGATSHLKYY
ncbi:hypothetical protein HELRODRAFT_144303, partial [Helobdella robusta]|uniref:GPS domain-containing protein n=1 Tax=Helobdella robusta TaxID=6412 RepID=T1EJE3_HELRO